MKYSVSVLLFHIWNNVARVSGYPWYIQKIMDRESIKAKIWNAENMAAVSVLSPSGGWSSALFGSVGEVQ